MRNEKSTQAPRNTGESSGAATPMPPYDPGRPEDRSAPMHRPTNDGEASTQAGRPK